MNLKRFAVLGGGISGLALAHRLLHLSRRDERPIELTVYESSDRVGGTIQTERRDGFLMERGPDSFLCEKPWAKDLAKELGLEHEVIPTQEQFRKTYIARQNKLFLLPEGFYMIAPRQARTFLMTPLFSWPGKFRILSEFFLPPDRTGADESVSSFIRRRFGQEALDRVGQAMVAGVYSGDPDHLSILSTMPRFREMESKYGSVIRGLRSQRTQTPKVQGPRYSLFASFREGMESLPKKLADSLPVGTVRKGTPVVRMVQDLLKGNWQLEMKDGRVVEADALAVTTRAKEAAALLKVAEPKLSEKLSEISYESVATLHLAFDESAVRHPLSGFGFVVPAIEKRSLMACSFTHRKFPGRAPAGKALLRAFIGGAFGRRYFEMSDAELESQVLQDLKCYLGIERKPLFSVTARYDNALPQYAVGHGILARRIEREVSLLPNLVLSGSSYRGTGIPDCIHDAVVQAEVLWDSVWKKEGV